jgi:pimeloyl-ACP methyl ester carboxylesterase
MNSRLSARIANVPTPIFFFRGYNSYSTDDLRFGPLNFGPAHKYLEPALRREGFSFYALKKIGKGSYQEQVTTAMEQIEPIIKQYPQRAIHLLGHSAGGLVARLLAQQSHQYQINVLSAVSITTPHQGAKLADVALQMQKEKPVLYNSLKLFGYDLEKRRPLLERLHPEFLQQFNNDVTNHPDVKYGSVVSGMPFAELPIGMQFVAHQVRHFTNDTDGLVEVGSQPWGEVITELKLDHGAVLGHSLHTNPMRRNQDRKQFDLMTQKLGQFMKTSERGRVKT